MADQLLHYFDRTDPTKNFERHMFRAGYVLQSAELNEIQAYPINRIRGIADALFKDGDVIRDAQVTVNQSNGSTRATSGALYLRGAVRGVAARAFSIPVTGTVAIGVYLIERIITEVDDPTLRDPASEVRNYQEPGAARLRVTTNWGYQGDGQGGEFFPVYTADNGILRAKSAPPQLDSVSQAIARYDRDSTGGDYVVDGLKVSRLADVNGIQQYSISSGSARVNGFAVEMRAARRLAYATEPDLEFIDSEPQLSATASAQRVLFDRTPVANITGVRITVEKTETLIHGSYIGVSDPLPDNAILEIVEVKQGATTYTNGVDYKLTASKVDWSLSGAEPSPGSSYSVRYRHITTVTPTSVDDKGFTITGAVPGSLILTSYNCKLPRIDRLCLRDDGGFEWIKGVPADYTPVPPKVPSNLLPLAVVSHTWITNTQVVQNDGLRVVSMSDLERMNERLDALTEMIAMNSLKNDLGGREALAKKGMFVDPFIDDKFRDAGTAQTAAIIEGELVLPISATFSRPSSDIKLPTRRPTSSTVTVLSQTAITGSMEINPYNVFTIIPATVLLDPPVDHFSIVNTQWASPVTQLFGAGWLTNSTTRTQTVTSSVQEARFMRQIPVEFTISGFKPNERIQSAQFAGLNVAVRANP